MKTKLIAVHKAILTDPNGVTCLVVVEEWTTRTGITYTWQYDNQTHYSMQFPMAVS